MAQTATKQPKLSPAELVAEIKRQPLIGVTAGAELLGIKTPNFRRDATPHLTEVPVEGSASVYFRSEVEQLAKDRAQRRNGRG